MLIWNLSLGEWSKFYLLNLGTPDKISHKVSNWQSRRVSVINGEGDGWCELWKDFSICSYEIIIFVRALKET